MATVREASGNYPAGVDGTTGSKDKHVSNLEDVRRSYAVVASDTVDLPNGVCDALNVTTAGAYKVTYANGQLDSPYLTAGIWHPMQVKRVWSTGSVATAGIQAGYESGL